MMEAVYRPRRVMYDQDWMDAFARAGFKLTQGPPSSEFVVFLHSMSAQWEGWPEWRKRGTWVALFANEFKHTKARMDDRFDWYGSQHTEAKARQLYGRRGFSCTWGLSPRYQPRSDWRKRPIDVGIVGNPYPKGHKRERIVSAFNGRLRCDIRIGKHEFRKSAQEWPKTLNQYKAMPSTETVDGAMSARHMEAVGTHTLNVVYPGTFSGVLTEDYRVTLAEDHSNIEKVVALIHGSDIREKARQHMLDHHTYDHRVQRILDLCAS